MVDQHEPYLPGQTLKVSVWFLLALTSPEIQTVCGLGMFVREYRAGYIAIALPHSAKVTEQTNKIPCSQALRFRLDDGSNGREGVGGNW